ncbi:venom metalloproteinase 3-like [Cotesia glomerata]|nr:venom metalloproteinase 3-like [Cotesia glomerata]
MTIMEEYDTEEKIIEHVLTMWDRVDETYQHLKKTNIKINLAGIVIPKDSGVFNFFYKHDIDRLTVPAINYGKVMDDMGRWLYNHTDIFPSDSYDAFMISTDSPDVDHGIGNLVGGTAMTYGACRTERYRRMTSRGGIIHDVDDFSYRHAVHELAHLIGIDHDQDTQCSNDTNTVMQAHNDGCTTTWSSCSENSFLERYGKNWFPCLANIPKHFSLIIV